MKIMDIKTEHGDRERAAGIVTDGGISLRELVSVPPPPPQWVKAMISQVLANPQPRRPWMILGMGMEWLRERWDQLHSQQVVVLVQPRLALTGILAAILIAVTMWHSSSQWSIADNLEYFAATLTSDAIYDLDWSL